MKKIFALIAILCIATAACAQQQPFTGNDYLKLSPKQRVSMVAKMINQAGEKGIAVQKSPKYYCNKLDGFYQKSPTMKAQPFADVLKTMMVMEYDWDQPGVDKEALAKKTLGDDLYTANKTRLQQKPPQK